MDIKPYTPLSRMKHTAIYRKSLDWYKELAVEFGVDENLLFQAFLDYSAIPFRLNGSTPEDLDFEFPESSDDADKLKEKFTGYLNTNCVHELAAIEKAIKAFDKPVNPDTAPEPPSDPEA